MAQKPNRVHRLLRLITLLQRGRGMSAAALGVELGISRRTLFRLEPLGEGDQKTRLPWARISFRASVQ